MATPVNVGNLRFKSKKEAEEYFRSICDRYAVGQRIPDPDHTRLIWLLARHASADEKVGGGVDHFSVTNMPPYNTLCFQIVRKDGTATEFSAPDCVDGKDASQLKEMRKACRAVVGDDVIALRRSYFEKHGACAPCQITGKIITSHEADAHHAPPFERLVDEFLVSHKIELSADLVVYKDNQYAPRFKDAALSEAWRKYHATMAVILMVAKSEHRKLPHPGA